MYTDDNSVYCENGVFTYNVINSKGDLVATAGSSGVDYKYNAYGEKLSGNNSSNPIGYRNYYYDTETGLYYLKARYYDPTTGQFTQEDTVQDDNLQYNLYGYCSANPVKYIDPSGHCWLGKDNKIYHDKWEYPEKYTRKDAVDYAIDWHDGFNKAYDNFSPGISLDTFTIRGGDCANFVSQCLHAGGLFMTNAWYSFARFNKEWHGNNYINKIVYNVSPAWCNVISQYNYLKKSKHCKGIITINKKSNISSIISKHNIQEGDVMYLGRKSGLFHATIISKVSKNKIKYAAHSVKRKREDVYKSHLSVNKENYATILKIA